MLSDTHLLVRDDDCDAVHYLFFPVTLLLSDPPAAHFKWLLASLIITQSVGWDLTRFICSHTVWRLCSFFYSILSLRTLVKFLYLHHAANCVKSSQPTAISFINPRGGIINNNCEKNIVCKFRWKHWKYIILTKTNIKSNIFRHTANNYYFVSCWWQHHQISFWKYFGHLVPHLIESFNRKKVWCNVIEIIYPHHLPFSVMVQ